LSADSSPLKALFQFSAILERLAHDLAHLDIGVAAGIEGNGLQFGGVSCPDPH